MLPTPATVQNSKRGALNADIQQLLAVSGTKSKPHPQKSHLQSVEAPSVSYGLPARDQLFRQNSLAEIWL